jgi:hypothetical protein
MRLLFGMIVGAALMLGVAYIHDLRLAASEASAKPLVNWDVVAQNWRALTGQAGGPRLSKSEKAI